MNNNNVVKKKAVPAEKEAPAQIKPVDAARAETLEARQKRRAERRARKGTCSWAGRRVSESFWQPSNMRRKKRESLNTGRRRCAAELPASGSRPR